MLEFLRGSWKTGTFHLNSSGRYSQSDIDILVYKIDQSRAKIISNAIMQDTLLLFDSPLDVSIHPEDSLSNLNINDSKLINIAEYIFKYKQYIFKNSGNLDYIKVKIIFFLLRKTVDDSYTSITTRIDTKEIKHALNVKMGLESIFPLEYAKQLIYTYGNQFAFDFLKNCLVKVPDEDFINFITDEIHSSKTIDSWLQSYMLEKLCRY
ncbi:MAG: hypothetical protein DRR16_03180 [Candidatus Parabeggiatoa sp. nov. 3]|nr:MAG: hypothetical protein DRR00_01000 [Gammaproteobacteria bacterium]RKZ66818.1 MAG: hypothetical protein DRQ99_08480 [Gammaproteobacteria bacterium]RKZ89168.1 MAG: hypothetical protein DRR16_03180 [Gammaproteobacteria bacterium]